MLENVKKPLVGTRFLALAVGAPSFLLVSAADYLLRNEISLAVFYFIPIIILTWELGWRRGCAESVSELMKQKDVEFSLPQADSRSPAA